MFVPESKAEDTVYKDESSSFILLTVDHLVATVLVLQALNSIALQPIPSCDENERTAHVIKCQH